ncbi:M12 family metallopeptidase [Flavobacterium sp.]|uniref:M12 family metallopeptidase n=1 Tax=Flavobacterium sp. TaxID=239 RepID=UPI00261DFF48|nr:M12 family metallopeptidase [Flavobacterium sp.]
MTKRHHITVLLIAFHFGVMAQIRPLDPKVMRVKFDISKNDYTLNDLMAVQNNQFVTVNFHLPSMEGLQEFVLQKSGDHFILNGDIVIDPVMLIPPVQNKSLGRNDTDYLVTSERWRWPNGEIPVELSSDITGPVYGAVKEALDELNAKTVLRFVKRTNQKDYIRIVIDPKEIGAASSLVGWQGGKQLLRIKSRDESSKSVVMHELLHASGIYHEQSRNDRDQYITIHMDRIEDKAKHNFQKESNTTTYSKYDFCSIMHYNYTAFATTKGDITIEVKDKNNKAGADCLGRYAEELSPDDILGIQKYYNISRFPCNTKYYQIPFGLIGEKWVAMGGEKSKIGLPLHWEKTCPDGIGKYVFFDNGGAIYYHPSTGTHEVSGEILKEWARQGYEAKKLGYPITDEKELTTFSTWNEVGYTAYSRFQNGAILWNPGRKSCKVLTNEAFEAGPAKPITDTIKNAPGKAETSPIIKSRVQTEKSISDMIFEKGISSNLGPVHSESSKPRPTAGKGGFFLRFEKGWVYYNPETKNVYSLYGPIMAKWGELNYETGKLGFPKTDVRQREVSYDGLPFVCSFDHGTIYWGPEKGAVVYYN